MISESDLGMARTPSELREFVLAVKDAVRADRAEYEIAGLKSGLYKEFLDEAVPLSCYAPLAYPADARVQLILGNQGYDAIVFDRDGVEIDRVELTVPHDGREEAEDRRQIMSTGFGKFRSGEPGFDLEALVPLVLQTCEAKSLKDYRECSLVVAIEPMTPFPGYEAGYETQLESLIGKMRAIKFQAKRVFLLVMPDRLELVHG